ncbi:MAG TPA: serine protease, partial [Acidobacteriota bacterium]
ARQVTESNLDICKGSGWIRTVSQCHRILGELDAGAGNVTGAHRNYDKALELARSISHLPALIEVLLARGRWASQHESDASHNDLEEALSYAITDEFGTPEGALRYAAAGGYRIYETDIRVALGWTHLAAKDLTAARSEAEQVKRLSAEIGYHWGQLDAAELLREIR